MPWHLGQTSTRSSSRTACPSLLRQSLSSLLQASLTTSSRLHYELAWKKLITFHESLCLPTKLPVSVPMMLLFIAHLHADGSAPASIVSTILAKACLHKVLVRHVAR